MPLSYREPEYIIPSYSLTGDLLSYRKCALRYRYYQKGSLPPSKPVQLWFGQFIHAVMEEAYITWFQNPAYKRFPWDWRTQIRGIELTVNRRITAQGIPTATRIFCKVESPPQPPQPNPRFSCPDDQHPHQLLASRRTERAINTWGQHLFPLITQAEVKLTGIRSMPNITFGSPRSDYYEVKGIIDVISGIDLLKAPSGNLIFHKIMDMPRVQQTLKQNSAAKYEVILDYKGMRRPNIMSTEWADHMWQIFTYAWLRRLQTQSEPLVGIIFYLDELEPSPDDIIALQCEIDPTHQITDILPVIHSDLNAIKTYQSGQPVPPLTPKFKEDRSIRIFYIDQTKIQQSLHHFDKIVQSIEECVLREIGGSMIINNWSANASDPDTCTTCDFQSICRLHHPTLFQHHRKFRFSIP